MTDTVPETAAARRLMAQMFDAAIRAAHPEAGLSACLPPPPAGRVIVIAVGKAAASMAGAFERLWPGPLEGIAVDRHGATGTLGRITLLTGAHPVPDERGARAAEAILDRVKGLTADDLVVALVSGGGSALLPAPPRGMTLGDEQDLTRILLASGLPIADMNLIRAHFSRLKGGGLAAAARPARIITFLVSDVPDDDPGMISSGPTIAIRQSGSEALATIRRQRLPLPAHILRYFERLAAGEIPAVERDSSDEVHVIASAGMSLAAAAACARDAGYATVILSDAIEGEAAAIGRMHGAIARRIFERQEPFVPPVAILSGGETTVRIDGPCGRGGRNTEFLLALGDTIAGTSGIHAFAADTDGIDGSEDNAGAFADGGTVARLKAAGLNARDVLSRHDSFTAFEAIADVFRVGQTGTNVNDLRIMLVSSRPAPSKRSFEDSEE